MFSDDEEEETETVPQKSPSRPGTNIHLWQFVKELLLQPSLYGNYIHWIDRAKGIFKIVDSVKVATLWGKRKVRLRELRNLSLYNRMFVIRTVQP